MKNPIKKDFLQIINKGIISIADQGVFSGTNFLISLLLGRWLYPDDYGTFSVAFSFFLLISGIYNAFLFEPLSVFGSRKENRTTAYFADVIKIHFLLGAIIIFGNFFGVFLFGITQIKVTQIMILCSPFMLLIWLVRRRDYSLLQPIISFNRSIIYGLLSLVLLYVLFSTKILTSWNYFLILSLTSVLICFPQVKNLFSEKSYNFFQLIQTNWNYGKWIAIASVLQWSSSQLYLVWIARYLSLQESAGYRAIQNFSQPLEQTAVALSQLLVPWFSNQLIQNRKKILNNRLPLVSVIVSVFGIIYMIVIWLLRYPISEYIYQNKYFDYIWLFPILLAVPVVMAFSQGAQIGTRLIEKPNLLLFSYALSGILTIIIGPMLIQNYGLVGAAVGRLISGIIYSLSITCFFIRAKSKENNL